MKGVKGDLDDVLLERYFIAPGNARKIGSIHVDDEDLKRIFRTEDLDSAIEAFKLSLPGGNLLKDYLTGDISLSEVEGRTPRYVRILLFLCWMQTSKTRQGTEGQAGERNFRRMLVSQLGDRVSGASMNGLDRMWEHLKAYLARNYEVELDLPEKDSYVLIGRTLKLAFPTWRARNALRKIRDSMPEHLLMDPRHVANIIRASSHELGSSAHSLEYNFRYFDQIQLHGGVEYRDTPFWRAWYDVVALIKKLESLEIREEEYGEHALYRVSPLGDRVRIPKPDAAFEYIPRDLKNALRSGKVLLEDVGFGCFKVLAARKGRHAAWMVVRRMLSEIPDGVVKSVSAVTSEWYLVTLKSGASEAHQAAGEARFGWHGGIRVGTAAYLGRGQFAPHLCFEAGRVPTVLFDGRPMAMKVDGTVLSFPSGQYSGTAKAKMSAGSHEIRLVPCANDIPEIMRQPFDPERHISEDEFYAGTSPEPEAAVDRWNGERHDSCEEMVSIGEALYARAARTLPLRDAFEIVGRGMSGMDDHPSPWEVIRIFVDAGWFDGALLRNFPSRVLVMRQLGVELLGGLEVRMSGPTTVMLSKRIMATAAKSGAKVQVLGGVSEWSLPRIVVRAESETMRQDFIRRIGVPAVVHRRRAEPVGDQGWPSVHGYHVMDRLDEARGYFNAPKGEADGLFRMERGTERNPNIYNSIVPGKPERAYQSPSIAMLFHQVRSGGRPPFGFEDGVITPTGRRIHLPSSWARWLADVTLANPGMIRSGSEWRYAYPATEAGASAVADLVPVRLGKCEDDEWVEMFLKSASRRGRAIFAPTSACVRSGRTVIEKSFE
ncbi:hypothetical protein V6767_04845 [Martelella sp. FLE1502]